MEHVFDNKSHLNTLVHIIWSNTFKCCFSDLKTEIATPKMTKTRFWHPKNAFFTILVLKIGFDLVAPIARDNQRRLFVHDTKNAVIEIGIIFELKNVFRDPKTFVVQNYVFCTHRNYINAFSTPKTRFWLQNAFLGNVFASMNVYDGSSRFIRYI